MNILTKAINEHKLIRRLLTVWVMAINTWVIYTVFTNPPNMSMADATALASVTAFMNVLVGVYFYKRHREDQENASNTFRLGDD